MANLPSPLDLAVMHLRLFYEWLAEKGIDPKGLSQEESVKLDAEFTQHLIDDYG